MPSMECKKLFTDEDLTDPTKDVNKDQSPNKMITLPEMCTPKSLKKISMDSFFSKEILEMMKTPEPSMDSPSSVLNPPSSLKRKTIRDYFAAAS